MNMVVTGQRKVSEIQNLDLYTFSGINNFNLKKKGNQEHVQIFKEK